MTRPLLMLDAQASAEPRPAPPGVEMVDLYDLAEIDLGRFAALLVAGMVDQEFLLAQRPTVEAFLDRGRVVVFCGQLFRPWLPGCEPFAPATIRGFGDYVVQLSEPHPVYAGVDPTDLTFRRGVAGFFARGHHPPPPGATVLATLAGGQPITWVDETTTAGTVFVHSGADLLAWAGAEGSAARVVPQLLDWARDQGSRS